MFSSLSTDLVYFETPFSFLSIYTDSDFVNLRSEELTGSFVSLDLVMFQATHTSMIGEYNSLQAKFTSQGALNIIG